MASTTEAKYMKKLLTDIIHRAQEAKQQFSEGQKFNAALIMDLDIIDDAVDKAMKYCLDQAPIEDVKSNSRAVGAAADYLGARQGPPLHPESVALVESAPAAPASVLREQLARLRGLKHPPTEEEDPQFHEDLHMIRKHLAELRVYRIMYDAVVQGDMELEVIGGQVVHRLSEQGKHVAPTNEEYFETMTERLLAHEASEAQLAGTSDAE